MKLPKQVKRCNTLFRTELGNLKYAWKWSEDLLIEMRLTDEAGAPKFGWTTQKETGLIIARPLYGKRKLCLTADHQWILCRKCPPPMSEHQWGQVFGTYLQYPNAGMWQPCDSPLGPVALPRDVLPTIDLTNQAIRMMKRELALTSEEVVDDVLAQQDKRKKANWDSSYECFKDAAPAFGGVPGWKTHFSIGGTGKNRVNNERTL